MNVLVTGTERAGNGRNGDKNDDDNREDDRG